MLCLWGFAGVCVGCSRRPLPTRQHVSGCSCVLHRDPRTLECAARLDSAAGGCHVQPCFHTHFGCLHHAGWMWLQPIRRCGGGIRVLVAGNVAMAYLVMAYIITAYIVTACCCRRTTSRSQTFSTVQPSSISANSISSTQIMHLFSSHKATRPSPLRCSPSNPTNSFCLLFFFTLPILVDSQGTPARAYGLGIPGIPRYPGQGLWPTDSKVPRPAQECTRAPVQRRQRRWPNRERGQRPGCRPLQHVSHSGM